MSHPLFGSIFERSTDGLHWGVPSVCHILKSQHNTVQLFTIEVGFDYIIGRSDSQKVQNFLAQIYASIDFVTHFNKSAKNKQNRFKALWVDQNSWIPKSKSKWSVLAAAIGLPVAGQIFLNIQNISDEDEMSSFSMLCGSQYKQYRQYVFVKRHGSFLPI